MATRRTFSEAEDHAKQEPPARKTWPCKAYGCPMPGAIDDGICAYHWSTHSAEWQRVTQALREASVLTAEINRARWSFINAGPSEALQSAAAALARLRPGLTSEQLGFIELRELTDYRDLVYRLEMLVGQIVQRVISRKREEQPRPAPAQSSMRSSAEIYNEMFP